MIALLILGLFCVYLILSICLVRLTAKYAAKSGLNRTFPLIIAIIVVTLPVSYMTIEYIITKAAFNRYCTKEAGVWIYKTVDQWKKENPGVAETLKPYTNKDRPKKKPEVKIKPDEKIGINRFLNQRFIWVRREKGPTSSNIFEHTGEIIDAKTGEVMARWIDFSSGYGNPFQGATYGLSSYKVWLVNDNCSCRDQNYTSFSTYRNSIENIGGL